MSGGLNKAKREYVAKKQILNKSPLRHNSLCFTGKPNPNNTEYSSTFKLLKVKPTLNPDDISPFHPSGSEVSHERLSAATDQPVCTPDQYRQHILPPCKHHLSVQQHCLYSAHLHTCTACTPVQLVLLVDGEFLLGIITVS